MPPGMTRDCVDPWTYIEFTADGDVKPCCIRNPIGNILTDELNSILNSAVARQLRRNILTGTLDTDCIACGLHGPIMIGDFEIKVGDLLKQVVLPPTFNEGAYLQANPDVAAAQADARIHFLAHGRFENRKLSL
jgi:hypothetical protein